MSPDLSRKIKWELLYAYKNSGYIKITDLSDKSPWNPDELVAKGQYKIGIIIPDSITYKVNKSLKRSISLAFNNKKRNKVLKPDSAIIEIFFDPITRTSYKLMLLSMLKEYNMHIENKMMLQEVKKRIPFSSTDIVPENIVNYREKYASIEGALIIPNSVQHNVPAWTLFALFFIVMSLFLGGVISLFRNPEWFESKNEQYIAIGIFFCIALFFYFIYKVLQSNMRKRNTIFKLSKLLEDVIISVGESFSEEKMKYEFLMDHSAEVENKEKEEAV